MGCMCTDLWPVVWSNHWRILPMVYDFTQRWQKLKHSGFAGQIWKFLRILKSILLIIISQPIKIVATVSSIFPDTLVIAIVMTWVVSAAAPVSSVSHPAIICLHRYMAHNHINYNYLSYPLSLLLRSSWLS